MMLCQKGSKKTDCVCFAPWIRASMYKDRTKKWCPKNLCPTKTSMGKAKRDFPSFADVGQRRKREKAPFGVCAQNTQQSHGHALPMSATSLPNRLSQLGVSSLCLEGRQTRAVQCHGADFMNTKLYFNSLDSPETLQERLQQGGQWWRTLAERNRLLERGL